MQPTILDYKNKTTNLQVATIFICFLMNMLDGMDVMVVSYAAKAIADEWHINPTQLGWVFSAGLLGMATGAMFLASVADIIGRRAVILISAALMGVCVWATIFSNSLEQLMFIRFISGLGIGSMLASTATLAAEYAPTRTKDFWVSSVMSGYALGAIFSGLVASQIIPHYGWRLMFQIAGISTLVSLPLIYLMLSESLEFLFKTQPKNALAKANSILGKMKIEKLKELPAIEEKKLQTNVAALLSNGRRIPTFYLWTAFFLSFATLYFLTMWIPKLVSTAGLSMQLSIYAGTVFNLGAFIGIITQGYLSSKFGLQRVICYFLIATAILMVLFGFNKGSVWVLSLLGLIGFAIQGGFVGLYSVAARLYPTEVRSTGVGWSVGVGRIGAIVGPSLGGVLITWGLSMSANFIFFAVPTVIAGVATLFISFRK